MLSGIFSFDRGSLEDRFPRFLGHPSEVIFDRERGLHTSDRRDLDKGLSLSPGAILYALRRPLLDFEALMFKTAMDLRLAGEIFGEETMVEARDQGEFNRPGAFAETK